MRRLAILGVLMILVALPLFGGDSKVSGLVYMDYVFEDADNNEFGIRRAYLTYENKLSDNVAYKFQADVGAGTVSAYSVYIKNAKLDWKTSVGKVSLGMQGMNMFKIQEGNWGYRYIEKSPMDRNKFSSSADLGIGWYNSFGALGTSVLVTNGGGYKKAEADGHKKVSLQVFTGDAKLKEGFNAGVVLSYEGLDYGTDSTGSTLVIGGFGGLRAGALKVGAEYDMRTVSKASDVNSSIVSAYGTFTLKEKYDAFARVDMYDPDADTENDSETWLIAGVIINPEPGVSIAPNLRITTPEGQDAIIVYHVNFQFKF